MSRQKNIMDFGHIPVLPRQTVGLLTGERQGRCRVIDCTLGCGGHSALILKKLPEALLLGIDRDADALARAEKALAFADGRVRFAQSDFASIKTVAQAAGWDDGVDMILLDLGVSSPQIDDPQRGFSFRYEGPLDMRMDKRSELTASRVLNTYSERELDRIFREYGELRESRRLARAIVEERAKAPFERTSEFARLCDSVLKRYLRKNAPPAPTLCFQALRIEVNDELGQLERALEDAVGLLNPKGRIAVISFHSLEDRIVKHFFQSMAETCKWSAGVSGLHLRMEAETGNPDKKAGHGGRRRTPVQSEVGMCETESCGKDLTIYRYKERDDEHLYKITERRFGNDRHIKTAPAGQKTVVFCLCGKSHIDVFLHFRSRDLPCHVQCKD